MATRPPESPAPASTPEVPADGTAGSEFGDTLRRARERRGLSLAQVAQATKISPYHLEALERGTFINVPSGFYQRAQIREYARAVDLDPDVALAQLDRPSASPVPRPPAPEPEKAETPVLWRKRALMAVVVILAAVALGRAMGEWEPAAERHNDPGNAPQPRQPVAAVARPSGDAIEASARPQLNGAPAAAVAPAAPPDLTATPAPAAPSLATASSTMPTAGAAPSDRTSATDGRLTAGVTSAAAATPPVVRASAASAIQTAVTSRPTEAVAKPVAEAPARDAKQSEVRSAAPPLSGLIVSTSPPGARVTVNGIAWGITPLTIRYLPEGDKRIRVSKDGFAAAERSIRLAEGGSTTVEIQLHSTP